MSSWFYCPLILAFSPCELFWYVLPEEVIFLAVLIPYVAIHIAVNAAIIIWYIFCQQPLVICDFDRILTCLFATFYASISLLNFDLSHQT